VKRIDRISPQHFTGTTVLRLQDGFLVEELGFDDGVTALMQFGLPKNA
jgi:hypothetical protein